MFFKKVITAIRCDSCSEEIKENFPKCIFPKTERHYCWDCSYIKGYCSEKDYLKVLGYSPGAWHIVNGNGKLTIKPGKKSYNTSELRNTSEYKRWRKGVLHKDGYKCKYCECENNLNAHHLKSFAHYEDLRFDVNNGITLCETCHRATHKRIREAEKRNDGR